MEMTENFSAKILPYADCLIIPDENIKVNRKDIIR